MNSVRRLGVLLRERQRCLLVGLLAVLHLAMISATPGAVSLMCWLVDVGLFMLWQPFVRAERKLDAQSLSVLVLALAAGIWLYGWWR